MIKKKFKWSSLSPASKKRAKQNREYSVKRKLFLQAHPYCQWWLEMRSLPESRALEFGCPPSNDIHHRAGRIGKLLIEERYWMAVSRAGHLWIHQHPKESESLGFIIRLRTDGTNPNDPQ